MTGESVAVKKVEEDKPKDTKEAAANKESGDKLAEHSGEKVKYSTEVLVDDAGPGTGDTSAGLKADGRSRDAGKESIRRTTDDVGRGNVTRTSGTTAGVTGVRSGARTDNVGPDDDTPIRTRRRFGNEEMQVTISRGTLHVTDRNGRKLEVGSVVHIPVRVLGFPSGSEVEVVYPPYIPASEVIPVYDKTRKELVNPDTGLVYNPVDGSYRYENDRVVDSRTGKVPVVEEGHVQESFVIAANMVERF